MWLQNWLTIGNVVTVNHYRQVIEYVSFPTMLHRFIYWPQSEYDDEMHRYVKHVNIFNQLNITNVFYESLLKTYILTLGDFWNENINNVFISQTTVIDHFYFRSSHLFLFYNLSLLAYLLSWYITCCWFQELDNRRLEIVLKIMSVCEGVNLAYTFIRRCH